MREPKVFLFDEPLSNLDAELRVQMRLEIAKLHESLQATMVYVTHDQVEAMTLADKIVVLRGGIVEQAGAPLELYDNPDNLFVAGFIGSPRMNMLDGEVTEVSGNSVKITIPELDVRFALPLKNPNAAAGKKVTVGIRPEHFDPDGPVKFKTKIDVVENLGGQAYVYAKTTQTHPLTIELRDQRGISGGTTLASGFSPDRVYLFDSGTTLRLR